VKTPVLVVGADGLIGGALTRHLMGQGTPVAATALLETDFPGTLRFDLTAGSWPALPRAGAAVLCAAVTSQEQCRRDPVGTRQLNVVQTLKLARELIAADTFVVFISTNLVFDGSRPRHQPDAPCSPRTEYGRQKADVERALAEWPDRTAVVRLTKVFHPKLPLLQKWRQELSAGREVNAFSDYVCSPIHLAGVLAGLARVALEHRPGVWQFSGPADVSYATLAQMVARTCGAAVSLVRSGPAPPDAVEHLPRHTTLDTQRARAELGLDFPAAQRVLEDCFGPRG
jgi:dTDP-4-dehydrorhamnose reductase